ncbi:MAG: fibronectin type III domain-containing protein, partial [bacterium]
MADIRTAYALLPEINVDDISEVEMSFRIYSSASTGGQFEVGVVTDISTDDVFNDTYATVYSDTITSGEWTDIVIKFTNYTGDNFGEQGKYIAIYVPAGWTGSEMTSNTVYIDEVVVYESTTGCEIPLRVKADNTGETSVSLSWIANEVSGYQVMYNTIANEDGSVYETSATTVDVTSNPATVDNLKVNTLYYAKVRSKCDDGTTYTGWSESMNFFTYGCESDLLPFQENFEGYAEYDDRINNCINWMLYDSSILEPDQGTFELTTSKSMTETCLQVPTGNVGIMPQTKDIDELILQLDVLIHTNTSTYASYVEAGIVRYVDDELSFISFETFIPSTTNVAYQYRINYSSYADQIQDGDQIAIYSMCEYIGTGSSR